MQRAFDYFAIDFAGGKRPVLMAAERLNRIVFAVCVKERNPCTIDVELLAAILPDFALLGNLDQCQLWLHFVAR